MVFPYPDKLAFEADIPAVVAVHDLQHRLQPQFPEVSAHGEAEGREYLFRNVVRAATLVLVDSNVGKEDVLACYGETGIKDDDIFVLPFVPPPDIRRPASAESIDRVRARYALPEKFAFYPAAFWPHKNHGRLFAALAVLARRGDRVNLVLVGSTADTFQQQGYEASMRQARNEGVTELIHHLGFVPDEDMAPLYAAADALLFPTFFGPTNIPVLEAWAQDVPVLTSDIRGIREQCGDAAVLIDPTDPNSIAAGIHTILHDHRRRADLVSAGKRRLDLYGVSQHRALVGAMIREAKRRVSARKEEACR